MSSIKVNRKCVECKHVSELCMRKKTSSDYGLPVSGEYIIGRFCTRNLNTNDKFTHKPILITDTTEFKDCIQFERR